jgi:hypothetical protein
MNILETLQKISLLFLLGFPLIMICLIGFLSISVLNVGTIFLFVGQVVLVPVCVFALHIITWILPGTHVPPSDVGLLVPSIKEALSVSSFNVGPSFWVSHVVFLCSYIFTNAYTVYNLDASAVPGPAWKLENRKARSFMIMATSVFLLITLLVSRYYMTGAETIFGMIIALAAFAPLGYYWYEFAIKNGSQNGDIFGIIQQILPAMEEDTTAALCMKNTA